MKVLRILAAGAALLTMASCGKEYNSIPNGNNTDNPLLPLGTAGEGQIRFNLWQEKVRITGAYWSDTMVGSATYRQIVGGITGPDGAFQSVSMIFPYVDTAKKVLTSKDSVVFNFSLADLSNPAEPVIGKIYSNQSASTKGSAMTVALSQQDATTLRGNFSGILSRQYLSADSNDVVELTNGTFWVKKRQ